MLWGYACVFELVHVVHRRKKSGKKKKRELMLMVDSLNGFSC